MRNALGLALLCSLSLALGAAPSALGQNADQPVPSQTTAPPPDPGSDASGTDQPSDEGGAAPSTFPKPARIDPIVPPVKRVIPKTPPAKGDKEVETKGAKKGAPEKGKKAAGGASKD